MEPRRIITRIMLLMAIVPVMARADGVLMSRSPRNLDGMPRQRWEAARKQSAKEVLKATRTVRSWPDAYLCMVGAMQHKEDKVLLAGLADQLTHADELHLKDTGRLIIWERVASGDITFEGERLQIEDDRFTAAGRANWILRSMTRKNFGYVRPGPSGESLLSLQEKWRKWLAGEQVQEYVDPYPAAEKGLAEIKSPAAIQALVVSLQPSQEKDRRTTQCLHEVYHLEKLPTEPGAPGRLCSPDPWAYTYLAKITDVDGQHDPAWWLKWWEESKSDLVWDPAVGKFRVRRARTEPR